MLNSCSFNNGDYVNTYFGDRYSSSGYSGGYGYSGTNRVASSANLNRVARDLAQGYSQDIDIMNDYLEEGNTSQALKLYQELFENAKDTAEDYGYELTDSQIRSSIDKAFQGRTGVKLSEQASNHGTNSFVTGLLEGIPIAGWFFANANSKADARAAVQGKDAGRLETTKEILGATVASTAGIVGLGLANSAIAGLTGVGAAIANASGISLLAKGAAAILATVTGGAGILPLLAAGAVIGTVVVLGKQLLANKAS